MITIVGTTLNDTTNLLHETYGRESLGKERKFMLNVIDVYTSIAHRSLDEAEMYWNRFALECKDFGLNSDYIQSQYFVSFDLEGRSIFKLKKLNELGIFNGVKVRQGLEYKVGSIDTARSIDYCAYCSGSIWEEYDITTDTMKYETVVNKFRCLNEKELKHKSILDIDTLTQRLVHLCYEDNLDMLVFESTANQIDRAYVVAKALKARGLKTVVIPIDYSSKNKKNIYDKAETDILSEKVHFPTLDNTRTDKWFKELLSEFETTQKIVKDGNVKYHTPEKTHDDFISCLFQMIYLPYLCMQGKIAKLSEDLWYPIEMTKGSIKKKRLSTYK